MALGQSNLKMFVSLITISTISLKCAMGIFIGGEQDVGSPLRVAQCRATCLEKFSNDGPDGESMCLQGPDCFMCWENCELLQSNFQVWGAMCKEKEICFPGCQEACHFHSTQQQHHQTQPVIHTKGEGVIQILGQTARWPRPQSITNPKTPLVYVVMIKNQNGVWRQIIQTLDLTTRIPLLNAANQKQGSTTATMLRVLAVNSQGLVTIYSPKELDLSILSGNSLNKKKKKTINTEIVKTTATTRSSTTSQTVPWLLHEVSLIHQKVLVIGEISWEPKTARGVYLVTWEVDGGGLKGNLFTDSTCVTLSLWPDTIYHIQVELVSRIPGVENLKSEMMDLDTGRALKVSTENNQDNLDLHQDESKTNEEIDFNSPLLSVLVSSAVRGGSGGDSLTVIRKERRVELSSEVVWGVSAAIVLFVVLLLVVFLRWKRSREGGRVVNNMITGLTNVRSRKLVEDGFYTGFQPIISVMTMDETSNSSNLLSSTSSAAATNTNLNNLKEEEDAIHSSCSSDSLNSNNFLISDHDIKTEIFDNNTKQYQHQSEVQV